MSKAEDDEMTFVLLARDIAAPATIRFWTMERVRLGKNSRNDDQMREARGCAMTMEEQGPPPPHEEMVQDEFDQTIGRLDRVLSELVNYAKGRKGDIDDENKQTLKHHAEDMVAAAECILKRIGEGVEGTPQPDRWAGQRRGGHANRKWGK